MTRVCAVDQCGRAVRGRGLCRTHYYRLLETGDTGETIRPQGGWPIESSHFQARFWERVAVGDPDQCWLWTGPTDNHGYGILSVQGCRGRAHRVSAELAGLVIGDLHVLHSCDNPPCVNPAHLSPGTHVENMAQMATRGRRKGKSGVRRPNPRGLKLTDEDVQAIRQRLSQQETQSSVAELYGVSQSIVSLIASGRRWGWVK